MGDYFLGEIRTFSFANSFTPSGWAQCNGQILAIQQYAALYSLLGVQFGGDSRTNFNLPDLRGRAIVGAYNGLSLPTRVSTKYPQGVTGKAGAETVTLTADQVPAHTHSVYASSKTGEAAVPANALCANAVGSTKNFYTVGTTTPTLVPLDSASIASVGGGAAHPNMQPYLTLNFCIATSGVYPSRQ